MDKAVRIIKEYFENKHKITPAQKEDRQGSPDGLSRQKLPLTKFKESFARK